MIPRAYITEWTQYAPWKSNEQVEQDLVICRALVEIFSDEFLSKELAFRGGTALHKLYLNPQPRYSEDIDLVQVNEGAIGPVLDRIRALLDPLFESKAKYKKTLISNKLTYRFQSEFPPVQIMKLKIEINCREHFTELGYVKVPFEVNSKWYKGSCLVNTYRLEELMGTKLRALYQRTKGRDLYDQYQALTKVADIDINKVLRCYYAYMHQSNGAVPTRELYLQNIEEKMSDPEFIGDTTALIRTEEDWNAEEAYKLIKTKILFNFEKDNFMIQKNISIIVAIAENFAIGKNNDLLFHLPNDLKHFKEITSGHTIIMGRNTLLSLPKWPLPNRRHIVITDKKDDVFEGCETVFSIDEAIEKVNNEEEAFVIGGGMIYKQFFPVAGKLYLTLVHKQFDADVFFPEINYSEWNEISREDFQDEKNGFEYSYLNLGRK